VSRRKGEEVRIIAANGKDAALIKRLERDHELNLPADDWGRGLSNSWQEVAEPGRRFARRLRITDSERPAELDEHILRFPSAPIYGINRKPDYSISFDERPNRHTLRLLTRPDDTRPVGRLFILHNGLNETGNLRFYYRLADWILNEDKPGTHSPRSACLIVPFAGHLMHAPFQGPFTETPLSRYLRDSGELFRQFLRYMVEMRWLLSMVNRRRPADWTVGGRPLRSTNLKGGLHQEWARLHDASRTLLLGDPPADGDETHRLAEEARLIGMPIGEAEFGSMVDVIRSALGREDGKGPDSTPVHVVGYSLGGFLAQSVFLAWPNMVSSCATICSGGAIRALSPTAFAHSEEWQAVLHTLRPELEESMLKGRISRKGHRVAGLPVDQFGYYQRVFDQVFMQEDQASYKARLSEYGTRMLFISGGEDPIVKTRDVLDASPTEGITMLSVASLTHFLGEEARTSREIEQREFWLPEAGGLIGRAAARAEGLHADERKLAHREYLKARNGGSHGKTGGTEERATGRRAPRERDLASPGFEEALAWVIDRVAPKKTGRAGSGWLFICRNSLPAAFLGPEMHRAWGTGLHHHDVEVQRYAAGLAARASALEAIKDRTTLVLPEGLKRTFEGSSDELIDPHSDAPGYLTSASQRQQAWGEFIDHWGPRTRWLSAGPVAESRRSGRDPGTDSRFAQAVSKWQRVAPRQLRITHLPDVWISIDSLNPSPSAADPEGALSAFIGWVEAILAEEPSIPLQFTRPLKSERESPQQWERELREGKVRIVRVSGAELNPRYRGRAESARAPSLLLLAHCAAALVRSTDTAPD
jgi:pimeloyl-ACP methyl ester carboxylesterase